MEKAESLSGGSEVVEAFKGNSGVFRASVLLELSQGNRYLCMQAAEQKNYRAALQSKDPLTETNIITGDVRG